MKLAQPDNKAEPKGDAAKQYGGHFTYRECGDELESSRAEKPELVAYPVRCPHCNAHFPEMSGREYARWRLRFNATMVALLLFAVLWIWFLVWLYRR